MGQAKRRGTFAERRAQALAARAPERPRQPVSSISGPHYRRAVTRPGLTLLAAFPAAGPLQGSPLTKGRSP